MKLKVDPKYLSLNFTSVVVPDIREHRNIPGIAGDSYGEWVVCLLNLSLTMFSKTHIRRLNQK